MWATKDFAAIHEIEGGSDRVIGVVAGAIVDDGLDEAVRKEFKGSDTRHAEKIRRNMFGVDEPLGSFGARINLAYLAGLLTEEGHADLRIIQKIRNSFAHLTETNTFDSQNVRAWCDNFRLIKQPRRITETGSIVTRADGRVHRIEVAGYSVGEKKIMLGIVGADEVLKTPKGKFVVTAKLFCAALEAYIDGRIPKPMI